MNTCGFFSLQVFFLKPLVHKRDQIQIQKIISGKSEEGMVPLCGLFFTI